MLQMLLAAGSAAVVAWLLFSKKKTDDDVTKKEKQGEKMATDKADVVKPSSVDNRVNQVVTPDETAAVFDSETKPAEALIAPVASTQQIDQTPAVPITAEAPPIVAAPTEPTPSLHAPQDDQQIQQEVPVAPSLVQAPPAAPIQETSSAAPQLDLSSPGNLDEVLVELAPPTPAILVPEVLAAPEFETAPLPPVSIEAPPTEMSPSLLAPQDAQQIQQEVPVSPSPVQAPRPVPIHEIPIAAPEINLASPGDLDEVLVEIAPPASVILVSQVLATSEPELIIPVELASPAPLLSVSEVPPPVFVVPPILSTSARNEALPSSVAAPVDTAPVSPQHQPEAEKKDSQGAISSDHLIVPKPTVDEEQVAKQPPSSSASAFPPSSPAAVSPEKDVMTALDIESDMVPEPQVTTAREIPSTSISTVEEVSDVETAVSPSQKM